MREKFEAFLDLVNESGVWKHDPKVEKAMRELYFELYLEASQEISDEVY